MKLALVFMMVLPSLLCETVILNDLAPEDVQARLAVQSLDLQYAQFLGQRSLPADQAANLAEGRFAENPEDYLQNSYQANQFHGQDGLGRAMFGYSDWNQGRLEARNANGEVRGSYQYVDAFGDDVIVNYWADSLGFHQTDNRQTAAIEQVTETPEVQAARLAHQRAWDAAAKAAQQSPDPMSDIYNANANRLDEEQSEYEQAQQILAQQQIPNQYQAVKTIVPNNADVEADADSIIVPTGAESRRSSQFKRARDSSVAATENDFDGFNPAGNDNERTGPPHGFFYSVDYPVQVVVEHPDTIARRLAPQSEASYLRRPTIVAPQQPQLLQQQQQFQQQPIVADANEEDIQIVPIRILDTKKFKRNDQQSSRRRQAAVRNRFQRQNPAPTAQTPVAPVVRQRVNTKPTVPAATTTNAAVSVAPSAPTSSEIIQIKSLSEQQREQELRRLVSNADAVDGVHDAQIHPKQAAAAAARKYRSYF